MNNFHFRGRLEYQPNNVARYFLQEHRLENPNHFTYRSEIQINWKSAFDNGVSKSAENQP